jgi:metal-responsive CopG/Arc/MetJ family transcriptional regulator
MGRPSLSNDSPTVRLHMVLPASLLEKVENYRFENRVRSNSEAIRLILDRALEDQS